MLQALVAIGVLGSLALLFVVLCVIAVFECMGSRQDVGEAE